MIGINETKDRTPLKQPVSDACELVKWLVEKGGVLASNILLLTSPVVQPPKDDVVVKPATRSSIYDAVVEKVAKWPIPSKNERLYFYYSGHGTRFERNDPANGMPAAFPEDGILPCDFEPGDHDAFPVLWFLEYFRNTHFSEQLFFLDACRNKDAEVTLTSGKRPPVPPTNWKQPKQFVLYSSKPGQVTVDDVGAFTGRLVEALRKGRGKSKVFDGRANYVINWFNLAEYLKRYFESHPIFIDRKLEDGRQDFMQPTMGFWPHDDIDLDRTPLLTILAEPEVEKVKVKLELMPVGPQTLDLNKVQVMIADGTHEPFKIPPGPPPVVSSQTQIWLYPHDYSVMVQAGGWFDPKGLRPLKLSEVDDETTLKIESRSVPVASASPANAGDEEDEEEEEAPPAPAAPAVAPNETVQQRARSMAESVASTSSVYIPVMGPTLQSDAVRKYWSGATSLRIGRGRAIDPGSCTLSSSDPFATLELAELSGALVKGGDGRPLAGVGRLVVPGGALKPGQYFVRHFSPGHEKVEHLVTMDDFTAKNVMFLPGAPGTSVTTTANTGPVHQEVQVIIQPPVRAQAISPNMGGNTQGTVTYSAPLASPQSSLPPVPSKSIPAPVPPILTGAADGAQWEQIVIPVYKRRGPLDVGGVTGQEPNRVGGSSLRVYLLPASGTLAQARAAQKGLALRLEPLDKKMREEQFSLPASQDQISVRTLKADPGSYLLHVNRFGTESTFALTVLPGRRCDLVFLQEETGRVRISQFAPKQQPAPAEADPGSELESVPCLLLQRVEGDLQSGPSRGGSRLPKEVLARLAASTDADPVALVLEAHLRSIQGEAGPLSAIAERLVRDFPKLADGHVAMARAEELRDQTDPRRAAASYRKALDCGLPILQPFLESLSEGALPLQHQTPEARIARARR